MWRHLRVTSGLYEVQTSMYTIVYNLLSVDAVFLFQVRVKARLNIVNDRLPAESWIVSKRTLSFKRWEGVGKVNHLSSLLTKSPNPGVSTTVKRRRTPFSSMSEVIPISNYDFISREKELHTSTDAFNFLSAGAGAAVFEVILKVWCALSYFWSPRRLTKYDCL